MFSTVTFSWVTSILKAGAERPLNEDDIGMAPEQNSSLFTYKLLSEQWQQEIKNSTQPSLIKAFVRAFKLQLMLSGFCFSFYLVITFIQPALVSKLLQYADTGEVEIFGIHSYAEFIVALTLGAVSALSAVAFNNGFYYMQQFGLMTRSAMIAIIFEKSLRISNDTRQTNSTGEIMTLMSVDVERLWMASLLCNWLVMGPIMCVVTIILLYLEAGYAALVVAASLVLWASFQELVSQWIGTNRQIFVKFTADRTKIMNEILQGIRVVKLYAWESPCAQRIYDVRTREVNQLATYLLLKMSNTVIQFLGPVLIAYIFFMTFVGLGNSFDTPKAYTILAILNIARVPIMLFPISRTAMQEALTSSERIRQFLLKSEMELAHQLVADTTGHGASVADKPEPDQVDETIQAPPTGDSTSGIELVEVEGGSAVVQANSTEPPPSDVPVFVLIKNGFFNWSTRPVAVVSPAPPLGSGQMTNTAEDNVMSRCVLQNVNLSIYRGEMVAIVGAVGSGKTSLVMALLGQMSLHAGTHKLHTPKIAYAGQEHWIQNMTVQDNILFDSAMNRRVYETVMEAAQLTKDMSTLPNGDATEIGERGINLSGGQKARVNIARALYCPGAEMYVFDDPLAAVDVHVGKALFNEAFLGLLGSSAVVLTFSSNYQFLKHFDKIVVVGNDGSVNVCSSHADMKTRFPMYAVAELDDDTGSDVSVSPRGKSPRPTSPTANRLSDIRAEGNENTTTTSQPVNPSTATEGHEEPVKVNTGTLTKEDQEVGAVTASVYTRYFASSLKNSRCSAHGVIVVILVLFLLGQLFRVYCDLFVGEWASNSPPHSDTYYYTIFSIAAGGTLVFVVGRSVFFLMQCLGASKALHDDLLAKVLGASVNNYFDITPIGRILNRFSKDLDHIDSMLPDFFLHMLQNGFHVLAVVAVCVASTPFFVIVCVPLALLYYFIQERFRRTSRELRRMESVARSPIYTLFGELLIGLSTVRAYGRQENFFDKLQRVTDTNNKFFYTFWICSRWLALRLDLLGATAVTAVSLIAVLMVHYKMQIDAHLLGVAIVFALQLAVLLQWTVRTVIETENNMTSVERLLAFNNIQGENNDTCSDGNSGVVEVPAEWPSKGAIVMKGISMRYRTGLPLVLKDVSVTIPGGNKVGVCGRTGSGKSSLMLALFRIIEPEADGNASICIDDIDILNISLFSLRSRLTIIPQDPVMFSGTLRFNLDPFGQYSDTEIWNALENVELKADILSKFKDKLDYEISERGENVSVGQRQLLCIARALLRKSKVIIMDEVCLLIL